MSERRILYKTSEQTGGFMIEKCTLNIPKNYMLCGQVICRSVRVRVHCLQIQQTPVTWTNIALQYTVKHTNLFEISLRANIFEKPLAKFIRPESIVEFMV
jgi:hypothetical protein